jgi:hypothetical protein
LTSPLRGALLPYAPFSSPMPPSSASLDPLPPSRDSVGHPHRRGTTWGGKPATPHPPEKRCNTTTLATRMTTVTGLTGFAVWSCKTPKCVCHTSLSLTVASVWLLIFGSSPSAGPSHLDQSGRHGHDLRSLLDREFERRPVQQTWARPQPRQATTDAPPRPAHCQTSVRGP